MYYVDNSTAVAVMPEFKPVYSTNPTWFTQGDSNNPPTYPGPDTFNMLIAEMVNVLAAANIQPKKDDNTQLAQAIRAIINAPAAGWAKTVCNVGPDETGNIPLTAADLGALPDTYQAPVSSVNSQTGAVVLAAADVGALPDTYQAPVSSVNSQTGAVNLTAADVGALPDTYSPPAAPVTSVNSKTGAVSLTAADVDALPSTYTPPSGTTTTGNNSAYYTHSNGQVFSQSIGGIYSNSGSNPDVTVTLPVSFPNGILGIGGSYTGSGGDDSDSWWTATIVNAGSFSLHTRNATGTWSFVVEGY